MREPLQRPWREGGGWMQQWLPGGPALRVGWGPCSSGRGLRLAEAQMPGAAWELQPDQQGLEAENSSGASERRLEGAGCGALHSLGFILGRL